MQNSHTRTSGQKDAARKNAEKYFGGATAPSAKSVSDKAQAAADANTMRLRALRLAKEAADNS